MEEPNYREIAMKIAKEANLEMPKKAPVVKRFPWRNLILFVSKPLLLSPVPFLAIYKVHYLIIAGYIIFVAIALCALVVIPPRLKRKK